MLPVLPSRVQRVSVSVLVAGVISAGSRMAHHLLSMAVSRMSTQASEVGIDRSLLFSYDPRHPEVAGSFGRTFAQLSSS